MVEDASMCNKMVKYAWVLLELEGVLAIARQKRANVDGKVLLVGQRRQQRQVEAVIVGQLVNVCRQIVAFP